MVLLQPGSDSLHCSTMIDHNSSWENAALKSSASLYVSSSGNAKCESYWTRQMKGSSRLPTICHQVKFQSNFEERPETGEPLPSNANCWDSILAILPGWTRACVLFCNTWHIACHYSLSW